MPCSRAHWQIFHVVSFGIQNSNLSVAGPTLLTSRLHAALMTYPFLKNGGEAAGSLCSALCVDDDVTGLDWM